MLPLSRAAIPGTPTNPGGELSGLLPLVTCVAPAVKRSRIGMPPTVDESRKSDVVNLTFFVNHSNAILLGVICIPLTSSMTDSPAPAPLAGGGGFNVKVNARPVEVG